jgi:hypothetical protein
MFRGLTPPNGPRRSSSAPSQQPPIGIAARVRLSLSRRRDRGPVTGRKEQRDDLAHEDRRGRGRGDRARGRQLRDRGGGASAAATTTTTQAPFAPGPPSGAPWAHQRSDETLLTGDAAAKVQAAAEAKLGSGATIARVETDADGLAKYEAHATRADGTPVTVYIDASFQVVGVE